MNSAARQVDSRWSSHPRSMAAAPMSNPLVEATASDGSKALLADQSTCRQGDFLARRSEFSAAQYAISNNHFEELEDFVSHLLEVAAGALGASRVSLWLFDDDGGTLRMYKDFGNLGVGPSERGPISVAASPNYFEALKRGAVLAIESGQNDSPTRGGIEHLLVSRGASSALDVPIRALASYAGVLRFDHVGPSRRWSESERIFAASVGASVSLAIERQEHRRMIGERLLANHYDKLTNLLSRTSLRERIAAAIDTSTDGQDCALLLLDIDRFRLINEGFGKSAGDALLCEVACRLREAFPHADAIARLGNDEFAILLGLDGPTGGTNCIAQVHACLSAPYAIGNRELTLGATVGIVESASGYSQPDVMLWDVEAALNRAKRRGRGCTETFNSAMYDASLRRLNMEGELKNAVRRGELVYHYQPIVEMLTGRLRSSEALIRWHHPRRGLLPPSQFVEAIEEGGLLSVVGWSLLPEALRWLKRWRDAGKCGSDLAMNLNLTGHQLLQPSIVEIFQIELERHELPPSALRIEVTENTLISGQAELIVTLNRLSELGMQIQLDDFGTGFASLRHLSELPLNAVKIDRSFIAPLMNGNKQASIVESLIAMAHGLGLKVIAEGVEDEDQFRLLASLGCDFAQGFFLGKPMPADQLAEALDRSGGGLVIP